MVKTGQDGISPIDFASRVHSLLPVEVIERQELVARVDPASLVTPQRPSFYALLLMRSDRGSHTVDFTNVPASPGRLIQIRPGQIQVWETEVDLDATLVLSQPATASSHPWFPGHRAYSDLDDDAVATAEALIDALRRHQADFDGEETTRRLMTTLFDALVALFDQANPATRRSNDSDVYVAFRNAIEADLTHRHTVTDYARQLGYSARTITRACERATGQTAKRVLTDRLVLEAKRLLVHTELAAASISAQLGFSEATNFTKFFMRNTGCSPMSFRRTHGQTT